MDDGADRGGVEPKHERVERRFGRRDAATHGAPVGVDDDEMSIARWPLCLPDAVTSNVEASRRTE